MRCRPFSVKEIGEYEQADAGRADTAHELHGLARHQHKHGPHAAEHHGLAEVRLAHQQQRDDTGRSIPVNGTTGSEDRAP